MIRMGVGGIKIIGIHLGSTRTRGIGLKRDDFCSNELSLYPNSDTVEVDLQLDGHYHGRGFTVLFIIPWRCTALLIIIWRCTSLLIISWRCIYYRKRSRGPTMAVDAWNRTGLPLLVKYDEQGRRDGSPGCKELTKFISTLARKSNFLRLDAAEWNDIPRADRDLAWREIEKRYTVDHPCAKKQIIASLAKSWRQFRSDLRRKYFVPNDRAASLRCLRDQRVDPSQWASLVDYWMSDVRRKLSATNKANRSKQTLGHTGGTKSIPRRMHEMALANNGVKPDRSEMWCLTHTHKKERPMDGARDTIEKIKQLQAKAASSGAQSTGRNDILSQVLPDQHGRLRAMGFGATATNTWGPLESGDHVRTLEAELASQREQTRTVIQQLQAEREETRAVIQQLQADNRIFKEYLMRTNGVNFENWPDSRSQDSTL